MRARPVRLAGAGAVMVLAGLLTSAQPVAAAQQADLTLTYSCGLASGPQPVTVRFRGQFPAGAEAGAQIRPEKVGVTVSAPGKVLAGALPPGTAAVTGTAGAQALVSQDDRPLGAEWSGLTVPETAVGGKDRVTLAATGSVPPVTLAAKGDAVFTVGQLALRLDPRKPDGTAAGSPVPLSCTPALGQDTTLVTVPLSGPDGGGPAGGDPAQRAVPGAAPGGGDTPRATADNPCPPMPEGGLNPKFPLPPVEDGAQPSPVAPDRTCAYIEGKANADKLKGASAVRGRASVVVGLEQFARFDNLPDDHGYLQARTVAKSYLDTVESTFLTFDFMPTTAKMEITQIGNANAVAEGPSWSDSPKPTVTNVWAEVSIRLFDVRVNGTPMDVGPNCRSADPARMVLHGDSHGYNPYRVEDGGVLTGYVDIPAFEGCGVGEDLDRLFTASVSSKRNYVRLVQGAVCYVDTTPAPNIFQCPPERYGYTIRPGGDWRATSGPVDFKVSVGSTRSIVCESSTITGSFRGGSEVPPVRLGTIKTMRFNDCEGAGRNLEELGPVELETLGFEPIRHDPVAGLDASTGTLGMDFQFAQYKATAGACTFEVLPLGISRLIKQPVTYKNGETTFAFPGQTIGTVQNPENCSIRLSGSFGPREEIVYTLDNPQRFWYGNDQP